MRSSTAKLCFTGLAMLGPFGGGLAAATLDNPLGWLVAFASGVIAGLFGLFAYGAAEYDEGWDHNRAMAAGRAPDAEG